MINHKKSGFSLIFFQSNSPLPWLHFSNLLDLQVAKVASGVSDSDDDEPAIVAGTLLLGCVWRWKMETQLAVSENKVPPIIAI